MEVWWVTLRGSEKAGEQASHHSPLHLLDAAYRLGMPTPLWMLQRSSPGSIYTCHCWLRTLDMCLSLSAPQCPHRL